MSVDLTHIKSTIETFFKKENAPFLSNETYVSFDQSKTKASSWKWPLITGIVIATILALGGVLLWHFGNQYLSNYNALFYKVPSGVLFGFASIFSLAAIYKTYLSYRKCHKRFQEDLADFREKVEDQLKVYVENNRKSPLTWVGFKYTERSAENPGQQDRMFYFTNGMLFNRFKENMPDEFTSAWPLGDYIDALTFVTQNK